MNQEKVVLEIYQLNNTIQEKLQDFVTGCYALKDSSAGEYQLQKTIELNKIYFQGYVLNSKLCTDLKSRQINDYSLTDLKDYINKNFNTFEEDYSSYYQALELYEKANVIEELIDKKIETEIDFLGYFDDEIKLLKYEEVAKDKLPSFYKNIKDKLIKSFQEHNIDDITKNNYINFLNDIFEFFWSGYPLIN